MATELISLGVIFLCAIVGGIIAARFKQPAVFGLLLVGALIGPSSLNLVRDANMIRWGAEIGAILMLFVIGLEFDVSKLMKVGARSVLIGLLKFAIVLFFGYETALLLGFSTKVALFAGVILSFSSTVVVVKVLEQKEMFSRKEVPLLIAILIIEDILAVFVLTFFSGVKDSSTGFISIFEHVIFSVAILIFAYMIIMKMLRYVVNAIMKNNSDESVLAFLSLSIGTLFSYFAYYLGLTPSAGAFLAGSLIASLPNAKEYGRAIHPFAMIFTAIFFISMGTLVDFKSVQSNALLITTLIIALIISMFIAVGLLTYLVANFKDEQPFFASLAMIPIGEFSLLIAKESQKFDVGVDLVTITASIIFITAIIMSFGINYSEKLHSALSQKVPLRARLKFERLSGYMRKFFDQIEIENFFTKKLKSESKIVFMLMVLVMFASLLLRKISLLVGARFGTVALYAFYVLSAMIVIYLLNALYKRLREVHYTLSVILTHVDSSRNLKKCSAMLNNLLLALAMFFSAMLFPFAIFAFNLAVWANLIPFVLIVASFYWMKRLVSLMNGASFSPSYSASFAAAKL